MINYERLISLARETDTQSTSKKIFELNDLLSSQDVCSVNDCHLKILDDLISILSNTDNLLDDKQESVINLQEKIRLRIYQ